MARACRASTVKCSSCSTGLGPGGRPALGVGLAVVKLLVEQSGGTLTRNSIQGQGTILLVASLAALRLNDFLVPIHQSCGEHIMQEMIEDGEAANPEGKKRIHLLNDGDPARGRRSLVR